MESKSKMSGCNDSWTVGVGGASALKNEDDASWPALGQCSDLGLRRSNECKGWGVLSEVRPERALLHKFCMAGIWQAEGHL